jgi:hypothetical protein
VKLMTKGKKLYKDMKLMHKGELEMDLGGAID